MEKFEPLFTEDFFRTYSKLDKRMKERVDKIIKKVLEKPELGKPLAHSLRGLRSERIEKFRLIYEIKNNTIIFYAFEHRKKVYR